MESEKKKTLSVDSSVHSVSSSSETDKTDNGQGVLPVLGSGLKWRILGFLFTDSPKSYKEISDRLAASYDSVVKTMLREPDLFQEAPAKEGNLKVFSLTEEGRQEVSAIVEAAKRKEEFTAKRFSEEEERLKKKQALQDEVRLLLQEVKPDIQGQTAFFDFTNILEFNPAFADHCLSDPDRVFSVIQDELKTLGDLKVSIRNLPSFLKIKVEELRSEHINRLTVIEGRIVSMSEVRPVIASITFECPNCGAILSINQYDKRVREPNRCTCGWSRSFRINSKDLRNTSFLMIEDLQENTETANLRRTKVVLKDDLTESHYLQMLAPGYEVRLTGILREDPIYVNGVLSTQLGWIFEVVAVEPFEEQIDLSTITDKEMDDIRLLAERGLNEIVEHFAQGVVGKEYDPIKKALLLQICSKKNDPKRKAVRNSMNVLLIGDPGVAKSVMATSLQGITTGCARAFGGGSSAVGLTASVIKEEESFGGYRCEPGALVLAKNLLILEELNNLSSDEEKAKLQEGLSEQSVTINKANIKVRMRVTAGVLATANPKHGAFKIDSFGYTNIADQFNIPLPILNRFDVVFVLKDKLDSKRDKEVARRMLERDQNKIQVKYSPEFLKKFFEYIRSQDDPVIPSDIMTLMEEVYSIARSNKKEGVLINARFFESLTRLVKASARLRLSSVVERQDLKTANEILEASHYAITEMPLKIQEVRPNGF